MKCFRFAGLALRFSGMALRFSGMALRFSGMAAAACLALTACGGSSGTTAATGAAATASSSSSSKLAAYQSCLKSHGVTIKAGGFGGHPFSTKSPRPRPTASFTRRPGAFPTAFPTAFPSADATAFKDCSKYAPAGFGRGFGGGFRGVSASALAAFKTCMSQDGVKVTGTTAAQILSSLRKATGKTAAAAKTCRALLQPAGTSSTPSPSS